MLFCICLHTRLSTWRCHSQHLCRCLLAERSHSKAFATYKEAGTAAPGVISQHAAALHLLHEPEEVAHLLQSALEALTPPQPPSPAPTTKVEVQRQQTSSSSTASLGRCWQATLACYHLEAGHLSRAIQAASDMPHGHRYSCSARHQAQ